MHNETDVSQSVWGEFYEGQANKLSTSMLERLTANLAQ